MTQTSPIASTSKRRLLRWAVLVALLVPILLVSLKFRRPVLEKELIDAIKAGNTQAAVHCLNAGADPNTRDISEAKQTVGFFNMLDWLKSPFDKRSSKSHNPALIAVFVDQVSPNSSPKENLDIARALLDHGANINVQDGEGATPLIWALRRKWDRTAQLLLDRGADVHLKGKDGLTALMVARGEFTEKLLLAGADVHATATNGWTPLHAVCQATDLTSLRSLIAHGADVNAGDQDKATPLLCAAWSRTPDSLEAMKLLLAHGADVRAKTSFGITVLMRAAQSGNVEKVKLVLSRGVAIDTKKARNGKVGPMTDLYGHSPEVLKVLQAHGAEIDAKDLRPVIVLVGPKRAPTNTQIRQPGGVGTTEALPPVNHASATSEKPGNSNGGPMSLGGR